MSQSVKESLSVKESICVRTRSWTTGDGQISNKFALSEVSYQD